MLITGCQAHGRGPHGPGSHGPRGPLGPGLHRPGPHEPMPTGPGAPGPRPRVWEGICGVYVGEDMEGDIGRIWGGDALSNVNLS